MMRSGVWLGLFLLALSGVTSWADDGVSQVPS